SNTTVTTTIESVAPQVLSDYIVELISNANNNRISVEIHLDLNDDIFSIVTFDDPKSIVRIIIDKIKEGDDYTWTAITLPHTSTRFDNVATYYLYVLNLTNWSENIKNQTKKELKEVKQAIQANFHLDPVQIRAILCKRFDILNITAKQIHYWWSVFTQNLYKQDEDYVISALNFLKNNTTGCKLYIINLVKKHFNMHSKILINANGQLLTPTEIQKNACLWACSTHTTIPVGKTNMMIESHWRVLKHYYLNYFNRPRLDYLVWVICSCALPDQIDRFQQIQLGQVTPKWFDEFKKSWNQLAARPITDDVNERYMIDLTCWFASTISTALSADGDSKMVNPEIYQQYESKVAKL
ncbi:43770_t:CDS:2, partial [Gigaspora margarita]